MTYQHVVNQDFEKIENLNKMQVKIKNWFVDYRATNKANQKSTGTLSNIIVYLVGFDRKLWSSRS